MASRLRAETGDRDVFRWFQVAEALHGNFYEDQMEPTDIGDSLDDVERLLDKLEPSRAGRECRNPPPRRYRLSGVCAGVKDKLSGC